MQGTDIYDAADDATMNTLRMASARGKKVKKQVDTRASKGRKIRCAEFPPCVTCDEAELKLCALLYSYHVHEKIQNFMIPIEAGTSQTRSSIC